MNTNRMTLNLASQLRALGAFALVWANIACSGGGSVDSFIGSDGGDGGESGVNYALDLDPSAYDFGPVKTSDPTPLSTSVLVTNNSSSVLYITTVSGVGSPDFTLVSETCTAQVGGLAPLATCSFVVEFDPATSGAKGYAVNLNFGITSGATDNTASGSFTGTGLAPAQLLISDGATYNFGDVVLTASADKTFSVSNIGNYNATLISPTALAAPYSFKGGSYPGTGGTCGAALSDGATCYIVVTFNPVAPGGFNSSLDLSYDDSDTTQNVSRAMTGTGATAASLSISDNNYDFGSIPTGGNAEKTFTITNTGGVNAITVAGGGLAAPYTFKGGSYPGTGGTCASTIAPSATCAVVVRFAPTTTGLLTDSIDISYNDGLSAQVASNPIQGTGVTPASLTISDGPTFDFGSHVIGSANDGTLTITNSGGFSASSMSGTVAAAPFSFKGGSYPGTGGTCANSLAPAATCTVVLVYSPTATGVQNSTFTSSYNNGLSVQSSARAIRGTATSPANLSISNGATYNYGTKAIGSSTDFTFTVSNSGGTAAITVAGAGLAVPFDFKGGSYPGTGGTCTATINAASNCTIVVTYAPVAAGTFNDTIEVNYSTGVASLTATRAVTAVGVTPANLTISDGPTYDFGNQPVGKSTDKTFTITNAGGIQATAVAGSGLAAPYTYKGGTFPGTGGTCTASTINPAATCTIVVNYLPTATGVQTDTIDIAFNDGVIGQTSSRDLTATAVAPASITISDGPTYDFGPVGNGASAEKTFTLTNGGGFSATTITGTGLAAPFRFKGGAYPGTGGTCSGTLAAAATCDIVVTYSPTNIASHNDTILINYNNGTIATSADRAIQGIGTTPASLSISDGPTYNFGSQPVGIVVTKTLTVTNTGGVPAISMSGSPITSPYSYDGGTYPGTGGTCAATLAAAATCTIVIQYNPVTTGVITRAVTLAYNTTVTNATVTRNVTGTGVNPANLSISNSPTYDFGITAVGASKSATLTVSNTGGFAASTMSGAGLAAPYDFNGGAYPGTGGSCTATLNAGASCTISVTFSPSTTGVQTDSVEINYSNGVSGQLAARALSGNGAAPANITISDGATYDFGTRAIGSTLDKTFTLTNGGGVSASSITGAGLAAPFSYKGGSFPGTGGTCLGSLAAAATCTVVATYAPTATGTFTDTIEVTYNDGVTSQTSYRDIEGVAVTAAQLNISDNPLYNYGTVARNTSHDHIFTIDNSGDTDATAIAGSGLAAPFAFKGGSYPGTGGTCGTSLVSLATCTIVVTYNPTANGSHSDTMILTYNNGATSVTSNRNIQGVAANAGVLSISNGATYNFGTVANTSVTEKVFTVTNTGGVTVTSIVPTGLAAPFNFKGGTYPGTGGTCTTDLAAATTCTFVVEFSPIALGGFTDTLDLTYFSGAATQTSSRPMSGTAVAPALLTVSDGPTYDFGTIATGGYLEKTFTVTNSGSYTASALGGSNLSAPFTFKGGSFPGTGTCGTTLNAGASCNFIVRFSPTITGLQTSTINVDYNNGASVQVSDRDIQGTGAVPALLTISDGPTYDFGTYASGGAGDKTFIVTNTGGVNATAITGTGLAAPFAFKGGSYPGTGGTCGGSLAASATCNIVIRYNPTNVAVHADTIILNYTDGAAAASVTRDLAGTAVSPALLSISDGATYNYGTKATGSSTDKTFTISNTGDFAASVMSGSGLTAPFTFKGGSYPGSGGTCGATLAAAATCTLEVTYAPTANGTITRTMSISYNNGATTQSTTRPVTGTGAAPANITISDGATYNFGTKATGSSTNKTFTISNTGGVPATSLAGSGLAAPYDFDGGLYPGTAGTCAATLNAGSSCTVIVNYAPVATGLQSTQLDMNYDNGVTGITVSRPIQGTGASPANLSVSDGPTYDYGPVAIGNILEKTFTITNSGGFSATSLTGSGLAAPFNFKGGTFPGTGGTCTATLAASATCTVIVRFTPTVAGPWTDTIDFDYFDGAFAQSVSRDIQGTAMTPALLSISDGPIFDFGPTVQNSAVEQVFTITNSGQLTATAMVGSGLANPFTFKGGTYPGTGGNCGVTLAAAGTCTVVVRFLPTALGNRSDTAIITYNNAVSSTTATVGVQGTGVTPANLTISSSPTYGFGTRANNGSTDATLTISNGGGYGASTIAGGGLTAPFSFKDGSFPGTGGTCTTALAAASSCTIVINYSPTTIATHTSTISITYNDGVNPQTSTRNVSGTAVPPANLTISDGVTYDYGTVATGGVAHKTFTLTNAGSFSASTIGGSGLASPFTYRGGSFPGTGGTCTASLAAAASCTFVVSYSPIATGTQTDTIDIDYNDGANPQTSSRGVQGTGAAPALLTLSDGPTFNYGTLASGGTADKTFTVNNAGGVTATAMSGSGLASPFAFKGGTYPGTGGTCAATLAATNSCTVVVTYNPTNVAVHNDTLIVGYNDGVGATQIDRDITGTAVAPANLAISDGPTYNFGTQANTSVTEKTFTITNTGSFGASSIAGTGLAAPFDFKGGSYPGSGGDCSASLNAAATCTIVVTFSPTVTGTSTDGIILNYNNGAANVSSTRNVQGTGAPPAVITISDAVTYNYGTKATGSSTYKTFTITNTGGVPATSLVGAGLAAPFEFEGGTYPGTSGTCTGTLNAAGTCSIVVVFSPIATGLQSDSIDFTYNNGVAAGQTSNRAVQGTGAAPASLAISDGATYDYGNVGVGGSIDKSFTVTNSGGVQTESMLGTGLAAPFTFKGGSFPGTGGTCAANLAASGTCTIIISFAPVAGGLVTDTLDLAYNDGVSLQNVSRDIQGTGVPPALLTISDGPTYNFGSVVQTTTAEKIFTVSNSGSLTATSMNGFGLAAPFAFKGGSYPGTGGDCGASLAAAGTCTMVVTFTPPTATSASDAIDMNYNDGVAATSTTRAIQGTGTTPANLTISNNPTYNFGTLANGGTADGTLTVTNAGGYTASSVTGSGLAAPFTFKGGTYPGTGGTCTATIAPAASCTVVLNYSPTTIAVHTDQVSIDYQTGLAAASSLRNIQGTAVAPALLDISDGATYDFGTVATGGYADKTFTITNNGSYPASGIGGAGLASPFDFIGASFPGGGSCTATLNAGASCTFIVRYSPSSTGIQSDTINVNYNDGAAAQTSNRNVQGTGANPALLTISDGATYNYGTLANGGTADKSFTITNTGGVPATGMAGTGLAAPFSFKGGGYPGTGGDCAASLAVSGTCTVVVTYNPTNVAAHSDTIVIDYTDGVGPQSVTRDVQGTAVAPANLTISDGATYDFGIRANGSSTDKTFTITNSGSFTASSMAGAGLSAPIIYKGGLYPGTGGTCSTSLAAAGTCTIVVSFEPTASGLYSRNINITYNNGAAATNSLRATQGTGATAAILTVSDGATYDYGTRATGSSTDKTFTITNGGAFTATSVNYAALTLPFEYKDGVFPGTGGDCAATLAGAATCTIVVTYAPSGTGLQTDTISITYNDGVTGQSSTRPIQGTGAAPANLAISDGATYDYGDVAVTGSAEKTFTISNSGGVSATGVSGSGLAAPYTFKGGTFPGTAATCTTTLTAGASCTVIVVFSPTASVVSNDTLEINYNNGVNAQMATRAITGTGVPPALLTISDGATYNYGNVVQTTTAEKVFTVTNSGSLAATSLTGAALSAPFAYKGGTFPGTGGDCPGTLAAAATCLVVVTFTPPSTGSSSTTVTLNYNNGVSAQTANRPVQGTGVTPANITISGGPTYSFGTIANNGTVDGTLTLTNGGGFQATSLTGSGLSAPFTFKGGGAFPGTGGTCTGTLAASASCTVVLTFSPTTIATHTNTFSADYDSGLANTSSTRNIQGISVAPANLSISDGATYDYGTVATGGSSDKTFTISNSGAVSATSMAGSGLSSPFSFVGGAYPGGGTCSTTLAAGGSCTIIVRYAPGSTGLQSDAIDITYNDGAQAQSTNRPVQGTGAAPALLTISDGATYSFGTVANGSSTNKSFTVTNTGGVPASGMAGSGLAAPFSFLGGTYPGTGGDCSTTLAASGTCTVVVRYNPTNNATHNDTLDITYNDGVAPGNTTSRDMTGTAVAAASLLISDGATYDFGTKANTSVTEKSFTVTNAGSFTASAMTGGGLAAPFAFKGGTYPGAGGTCSTTLAGSGTCTMIVTFSPTVTGAHADSIDMTYNNGAAAGQATSRPLAGASADPASISISDVGYDYGTRATGSSMDKTFTVSNSGGVEATAFNGSGLAAPFTFKDGSYPGTGGTCSTSLPAGNSCTVIVTYAPVGTGAHTDFVDIDFNDGVSPQTVSRQIFGTGAAPALLTISDGATYNFGDVAVGATPTKTLTITNGGGVTATGMGASGLAAPYSMRGGTYPGTAGTCAATLAASATCTVVVEFAPSGTGIASDTLDIGYNNGVSVQTSSRPLTGNGVAPALLTISDGATYSFGNVVQTGSADKAFTLTNTGSLSATVIAGAGLAAPYTFKDGTFPGTGGDCAGTLAPAGTCTFVVTFSPPSAGASSDTIDITYNNGVSAQTSSRDVQGTGVTPANLTLSGGPTYSFGSIANNGTVDGTITVTNGGGYQATSVTGSGLAAPYTFKGGGAFPGTGGTCTGTIAAGASCTMILTYSPTSLGTQTDTVSVDYNNGLSGQSSTRNLTGTSVAPASLAISDGAIYDYGTVATGGSANKTFTITNSGAVSATGIGGAGLAAPFTYAGGTFPGGGTCTTTLASSGSCTFIVTYAPTATGVQSDTIDINYNDGAQAQTSNRSVQGTGANPALLTISDGAVYNYGTVANGSSTDKSFTITNTGGVSSTGMSGSGLAAPFSFKGGGYPGTGGDCSATLAASATCTVVVTYNPTNVNVHSDTIDISYNDGVAAGNLVSRDVVGTSVSAASLTISDGATYDFGTRANGSATDKTFTLSNSGSFTASSITGTGLASPYTFKGGGAFPGTGGTCSTTLAGGGSCTFIITFSPLSTNTYSDAIDVGYNNGAAAGQNTSRPITGASDTPASITISDGATYDFGTRATGSTIDKTFTLTNSGGIAATSLVVNGLAAPYTFKDGSFPGTGGDCSTSLAGGTACTVVVTYAPTGTGVQNDSLDVSYNDGVTTQTPSRPITGTGANPANITISDGATYDYGNIAIGATPEKTFTITNTGGVTATAMGGSGLAAPFTFKGGSYPGGGGATCSTTLAASATCTIIVVYTPTASVFSSDAIDITYHNGVAGGQTSSRNVSGTGVTPAVITISDGATYNFGNVVQTGSADKSFTITNTGSLGATALSGSGLAAPFTFKDGVFPGTGGDCAATLAPAATCTVVVTFNPSATGSFSDTLDMTYNNGVSGQTSSRDMQGTGATPASLTVSNGPTYSFGSIANNGTVDGTLTVTNGGGVPATSVTGSGLAAPYTFKGGGAFPGTGGTCTGTIAAGASCTVILTFSPTGLGVHTDTLSVDYNNGLSAQSATRNLTGTAVAPANLTISDVGYDYGLVATGATASKTFTINNSGDVSATSMSGSGLAAPYTFAGGAYPGGGTCTATLASLASCTIIVEFSPSGTGAQGDTIDISYNDGANPQTANRAITGTGAAPASLAISDGATYDFGGVANGGTADKTFTVTNSGGVPATGLSGSGLAAPYTFKGGTFPGTAGTCTGPVAASGTCTFVVTFAPTSVGVLTDTIDLSYNNGVAGGNSVSRAVTGTGLAPALITISDGPTYNFGSIATTATADKSFTLTNTGAISATSVGGSGLAAPFTFAGGSFPGAGGDCGTSLAPAATCTVVIRFSPTVVTTSNDTLDIGYNNGVSAGQTSSRDIQGSGVTPASLSISDGATFDFGNVAQGGSVDKTFTITNTGGATASSITGSALAAPYSYKGGGAFPGTGGTCTGTLAGSATCTYIVTYSPANQAVHNATVTATYHNGIAAGQTSSRDMTGTGVAPASLTISGGPTYSFGTIANGNSTTEATLTINNSGAVTATGLSGGGLASPFAYKAGTYPGTGGTCTTSLNAAASCTIVVTYIPAGTGTHNDTVEIAYNDGASPQTALRDVTGTAVGPANLTISNGPTYDYGTVVTTTTKDRTFTITNAGGFGASSMAGGGLAAPYTFKGGTYPGIGGDCSTTLAAAGTCTVVVTFTPTASVVSNDAFDITYNNGVAGGQTSSRNITGTGAAPANISISGIDPIDYGNVVALGAADQTITLNNSGEVTATSLGASGLAAPYSFKDGSYPGTGGTCGTTLAAATSCTIIVTFAPTVTGVQTDTLDVSYNDGAVTQTPSRDLQGVGSTPAILGISDGATYNYGTVANGSNNDKTFTVNNSGGVTATSLSGSGLAAPYSFKGGTFPGAGGTCTGTLAASTSCTIIVTYAPTTIATHNDVIDVNYNDGLAVQTASRAVTGDAVAPAIITVSDGATYDFGSVYIGASAEKIFSIQNTGGFAANTIAGSGIATPYAYKGGTFPGTGGSCTTTLGVGSSCSFVVTYSPSSAATHNDTIDITYNDGANPQTAPRDVTGLGLTPTPPSQPVLTLAVTVADQIDLSWPASTGTGPITYDVKRSTVSGSGYTVVSDDQIGTTFNDTGVTAGTTYYYVITVTGLGGSVDSVEQSGKAIAAFTISSATPRDSAVDLAWAAVPGADSYTVRYGTSSGVWGSVSSTSATSTHTITGLTPGTLYYFMVESVNAIGSLNATAQASATPYALATSFAAGQASRAMCAIMSNGDLRCWGQASYGMLGNGAEAIRGDDAEEVGDFMTYTQLGTGRTVTDFATSKAGYHACAVLDNGNVKCWGRNNYGQLGLGDTDDRSISAATSGDNLANVSLGTGHTATKVAVGTSHSCAILDDGRVKCWGRNNVGQLGQDNTTQRGDEAGEMGDMLNYTYLGVGRTAVDIAAGADHTCVILDNATVKCWGRGDEGQLGQDSGSRWGTNGTTLSMTALTAVNLGAGRTALGITAGNNFSCARLDNSTAKCWGNNGNGQLGTGNTTQLGDGAGEMAGLAAIPIGVNVLQIEAGWTHVCVRVTGNGMRCWGANTNGQLGLGSNGGNIGDAGGEIAGMANISLGGGGVRTATNISAGNGNSCATLDNGQVKCWGLNNFGQLANVDDTYSTIGDGGGETDNAFPALTPATGRTFVYAAGGQTMICGVQDNGTMACFGHNLSGQLGIGQPAHKGDDPGEMGLAMTKVDLGTGRTAVKAAIGQSHVCAILDNGQVKCWGRNNRGQLGYEDTTNRGSNIADMGDALPYVNLGTGRTAIDITAGGFHTCAITVTTPATTQDVKCWGRNSEGQLGINTAVDQGNDLGEMGDSLGTTNVGAGRYAVEIKAGTYHTCARLDDGNMKCWGYNNRGQLGQGNTNNLGDGAGEMAALAVIPIGTTVVEIGAGAEITCARLTGGAVKCWGRNNVGQLGQNGTAQIGDGAGEVAGLANINIGVGRTATSLSVGNSQVCVMRDNNTVICWGNGASGRLGRGNNSSMGDNGGEMPVAAINIGTGLTPQRVVTNLDTTCVQTTTGVVKCFGYNLFGTCGIGDNTTPNDVISDAGGEVGDGIGNTFLFDTNY